MSATAEDPVLAAARAGDPAALDSLLRAYQPRVYRFGLRMCRDEEDARDVLQETLFAAARSLRSFRGSSSLSTWLYSIARGFCIKKRRRSKFAGREVSLEGSPPALVLAAPGPPLDEEVATREIEHAVESAIRALRPAYREVLLLRDVEGLTAPEVAEVLGLKVEAVKSRLHRARAEMRNRLRPLLEQGTPPASPQCPDIAATLSRYLEGEISRASCAEIEGHVTGCPRCGPACDALRRTLGTCRALPEPRIPPELQESIRAGIRRVLADSA